VLEGGSPFLKGKNGSRNIVPRSESPIEETYPLEDTMDIIEPSQPPTEDTKQDKHIDRSDPIEPADNLMESTPHGKPKKESRSQSPRQSPRKPGMAKRIKTRSGKLLSSQPIDLEADHPPESTPLRATRSEPSPSLGSEVRNSASQPTDAEKPSSVEAMPPPPVPAVKAQPRRGRPPLSQEVKAAREKAKADAKAQKADEKARMAAAKKAEKEEQARAGQHDPKMISSPKGTSGPHTEVSSTVHPSTPVSIPRNLDSPHSLDKWATIHNTSSPRSVMDDQLRSSSPGHPPSAADDIHSEGIDKQRTFLTSAPADDQSDSGDGAMQDNPLFVLSSSQVPFPYSQWQGGSYTAQAEDTPTESEDEVSVEPKTKPPSVAPKFRKLTDIASQAMFSQDILSPTPFPLTPVVSNKPKKHLSDDSDDEEDDDDSVSDSDTPGKSHIPKSRRAGATLRSKSRGGLSSFL